MNSKSLWISIVAVVLSFAGGFILANALNRSEMDGLRAENARLKTDSGDLSENESETALSEDEIRRRINEAEQNPTNFSFQKNLGLALYRYAAMKQDAVMLSEVEKILNRAHRLNEKDNDVLVALGNLQFDFGYFKKSNEGFVKAREYYAKALEQNPNDVDVRTDLGLTYFLANPPQLEKAIAEFKISLENNPKHEKTLQFLTQSYIKTGNTPQAEIYLARLKEINPQTPNLEDFQTQMAAEAGLSEK
jgi:tetratricopeptide (TPR) repeat protein